VGAISMAEDVALINEDDCIRCGVCHDVCPDDAVRHDSERIPEEVASNLAWVQDLLQHAYYANDEAKQKALIKRLQRYFGKNKEVIERTMAQLALLQRNL
jgi:Fe-S-cluster-containing hydrogenase component 2